MNRQKLSKSERAWILYDVGNSAFILLVSTIIPVYYDTLAGNAGISSVDHLATWGYAASIATLIGAAAGLALGLPPLDAVKVGHAAAALSVTAFGAQGGMPRMEQLLPLLADGWKEKLGL